ncbi:hypothetical protein KSF_064910 [Reticulibacter mediterranei]|uniref:Uncharacterized protein n=1 Tax=Reticulibacter mediterranei TaxID=2778369 RepID=A0A8J3N5F6_9CHLR|nr:hypothetical protein [Reticulibacter mediterranei]GHO96443.1 hypothetical protein KSF_064910 [Reticulibacter mediterranei]
MQNRVEQIDNWIVVELPRLNRAVLEKHLTVEDLVVRANHQVLHTAPIPEELTPLQAKQLVVDIGLLGASVGRHRQEADLELLRTPQNSFLSMVASQDNIPFLDYVRRLAQCTHTGHPPRDTYASLVRWNVPTIEVKWQGQVLGYNHSVFHRNVVRTYTGNQGEELFLVLLKKAEALEASVNELLYPIVSGSVQVNSSHALEAAILATKLLDAVHQINLEFTAKNECDQSIFETAHFMDILRQFAIHWTAGDSPPSGAQDPEFIKRDFYLGYQFAGYTNHVYGMFPALLTSERSTLEEAMRLPSIPSLLGSLIGIDADIFANGSPSQLLQLADDYPCVIPYFFLMQANGRVASSHLMLTKRFLFNPMRERDRRNIPDSPLVSNRAGTTGMLETLLEALTKPRRNHMLRGFSRIPLSQLARRQKTEPSKRHTKEELLGMVNFCHQSSAAAFFL